VPSEMFTPQWYIKKAIWESPKIMSTNVLWKKIAETQEGAEKVGNKDALEKRYLRIMLDHGLVEQDRAHDMPQFRKKGWKLVPNKAFKAYYPAQIASLNPIPVLQNTEYIMFLLRMKKGLRNIPKGTS